MNEDCINVKIIPQGINIKVKRGKNLLDIINENNIDMDIVCGGNGKCGKCKVKLIKGKLSDISIVEQNILSQGEIDSGIVLACKRTVLDDIEISAEIKKNSLVTKSYVSVSKGNINPIVKKVFKKLTLPTLKDQTSDMDRILREFDKNITMDLSILNNLDNILISSDYNITATILDKEIIRIEEGDTSKKNYAISIDLGTTSIGGYIVDLDSGNVIKSYANLNLQKKYGADVISRINYSIESESNLHNLRNLAIESIDIVINNLLELSNICKDDINVISILGNTTMSHLLMGLSTKGIAKSPFNPVFTRNLSGKVVDLGIKSLNLHTRFILLPNIAGYVGSDTLAVAISTDIVNKKGNWLAIDIGTNCELILKTEKRVLTCSTAAGPAFEGANMSCGIRAEDGAVYTCDISDDIYIKTVNSKGAIGICGSGYVDIVAKLIENKIIKKQGRIRNKEEINAYEKVKDKIIKKDSGYIILLDDKNNIYLSQEDISNLQLAKGAIKTGIEIMMKEAKIDELDGILLAGAFGSNLNQESLKTIKMIPHKNVKTIESIGNAAGSGGIDVLLHENIYYELMEIQKKIEHIELASYKDFNNIFTKSIMF